MFPKRFLEVGIFNGLALHHIHASEESQDEIDRVLDVRKPLLALGNTWPIRGS